MGVSGAWIFKRGAAITDEFLASARSRFLMEPVPPFRGSGTNDIVGNDTVRRLPRSPFPSGGRPVATNWPLYSQDCIVSPSCCSGRRYESCSDPRVIGGQSRPPSYDLYDSRREGNQKNPLATIVSFSFPLRGRG